MKSRRARVRAGAWALAGALALIGAMPAKAGHYTHERVIGFSEDGRYFAFKTYGLQRGSGLPFGNIFIVDLVRDAWVAGTPLRAGLGEEAMAEVEAAPFVALRELRASLMQRAAPLIDELGLHRPATVLHAAGIGQTHGAPEQTLVSIPHPDDPTAPPWHHFTLQLEPVAVPAGADYCPRPEALRGFRLSLRQAGAEPWVLHQDQRIPASRGCAEAYRLDAVLSAGYPHGDTSLVAMISVWSQGFEGLERHVIALPVPLSMSAPASGGAGQAPAPDLNTLVDQFLEGFQPLDPEALESALPVRRSADPSALRWPDADLPAAVRALELFAAQRGFSRHGRLWLHKERHQLRPEGAGGALDVALLRLQAHNLGQARRDELVGIFGEAAVAPPEAFDPGPDLEWRFVMRPVQGQRAALVAVAGRLLAPDTAAGCGPVDCHDPAPLQPEEQGMACSDAAARAAPGQDGAPPTGTATRLGREMNAMQQDGGATGADHADAWLIEHGLWQADATLIAAFRQGQLTGCTLFLAPPD